MLRYMIILAFSLTACSSMETSPAAPESDTSFQCRNTCEFQRDNCLGDLPVNSAHARALTCRRQGNQCLAQC